MANRLARKFYGIDDQTHEETRFFEEQMQLAKTFDLPVLIHTPHRDKKEGTKRTIDLVKASGIDPGRVLIDHNTEETLPLTLDSGCWAGHSVYPLTKMDEHRMVSLVLQYGTERITVNSAADWGVSDPLKVPKTVEAMRAAGITENDIQTIVWDNPVEFFGQSGRLNLLEVANRPNVDQTELWEGNSVLRGQEPVVDTLA